jgi:hypothetical protein
MNISKHFFRETPIVGFGLVKDVYAADPNRELTVRVQPVKDGGTWVTMKREKKIAAE